MGLTLIVSKLPLFLYYITTTTTTKKPNIGSNNRNVLTSSGAKPAAFSWVRFVPSGQTVSIFLVGPFSKGEVSRLLWARPQLLGLPAGWGKLPEHPHCHPALPTSALSESSYTAHHTFVNTAQRKITFVAPEHSCVPIFLSYLQV